MNENQMERVWHGSHRKDGGRKWSMYFAMAMTGLMAWVILAYAR